MVRFHVLGCVGLSRDDGTDLSAVLRHGKCLAILCLLSLGRATSVQRRDRIMALLWPDSDESHARGSLRKALFQLRRALGSDAVLGHSENLTLNRELVWCDATAFGRAAEEGDHEEALDLYMGPLMDGVHLGASAEFDQWLERERESLRRQAAASAWALVESAEEREEWFRALKGAQAAVELAPFDEVGFRRFIALCDRIGDRALALREYEVYRARLRSEIDLDPSPETRAVVRSLRLRCGMEDGSKPPDGRHPDAVAVLPFSVLGEEDGIRCFADGLHHEVIGRLTRMNRLQVSSRRSVLAYQESTKDDHLVASELGVARLVEGTVRYGDDRIRVSVDVVDAESGRPRWSEAFERTRGDYLTNQVELAGEIADFLHSLYRS